ncbi:MAG: hypothetical protein HY904_10220 [Deltaproteobacteria bacterium]|nr:hypothetical protein [Deltaproteobacteria bacterium]
MADLVCWDTLDDPCVAPGDVFPLHAAQLVVAVRRYRKEGPVLLHRTAWRPLTTAGLEAILAAQRDRRGQIRELGRALLGHVSIPQATDLLRREMMEAALGERRMNRSRAARLLGVSRQAVQRYLRE